MKTYLKQPLIYFVFLLNFLFLSSSKLPDDPLTGVWKGYLTQKEGGLATKYDFTITFKLNTDNRITGESRLDLPNGTFGVITLIGEKLNKKIVVKELSIKKHNMNVKEGAWCIKKYTLQLKKNTLKGNWFGCIVNSETPEGEIYLERE